MIRDRHIYAATAVVALVGATAVNVLVPREPFAGTTLHREASAVAQAAPPSVEVARHTARAGASL